MDPFPKYTKHRIFCTTEGKFADVDVGNLFLLAGDMLCVRVNYPARRQYARNTVIISAEDPGFCGMGMYIEAAEPVEIVTENSITLMGAHLV